MARSHTAAVTTCAYSDVRSLARRYEIRRFEELRLRRELDGARTALLASDAFSLNQFEREANFMKEAANLEATVRISTCSMLIRAGTTGAYGRTHHGFEVYPSDMFAYSVLCLVLNSHYIKESV